MTAREDLLARYVTEIVSGAREVSLAAATGSLLSEAFLRLAADEITGAAIEARYFIHGRELKKNSHTRRPRRKQ